MISVDFLWQVLSVFLILFTERKTNCCTNFVKRCKHLISWIEDYMRENHLSVWFYRIHIAGVHDENKTWIEVNNSNTISVSTVRLASLQTCVASCSTDSSNLFGHFNGSKTIPFLPENERGTWIHNNFDNVVVSFYHQ